MKTFQQLPRDNITLQCISFPCIWTDGDTLWEEKQTSNSQLQQITNFTSNVRVLKASKDFLLYKSEEVHQLSRRGLVPVCKQSIWKKQIDTSINVITSVNTELRMMQLGKVTMVLAFFWTHPKHSTPWSLTSWSTNRNSMLLVHLFSFWRILLCLCK